MATVVTCETCGSTDFDLHDYCSIMVLSPERALFTLECPKCGTKVTTLSPIPQDMRSGIVAAARKMNAGMGGYETSNR